MFEDLSCARKAHRLRRNHIFLFAQIKDLPADETSHTRPGEEGKQAHEKVNIIFPGNVVRAENGTDDQHQRKRRQTHQDIAQTHDDIIHDAAVKSRKTAHDNAECGDQEYGKET